MTKSLDRNRLHGYRSLEFLARQVVEGFITGLHKSPFHCFSVEFAEHRPYNSGESTKHIDWRLYGRTGKMYTKRYEEETNLRCQIVIDFSSSMHFPVKENLSFENLNKLWFSIYGSAVLMQLMKKQRDACGLTLFSNEIELSTKSKSSSTHYHYLYTELEKLLLAGKNDGEKTTAAAQSLHYVADSLPKRSLIIVFSDMFDNSDSTEDLFNALQHLRHNKHEVVLFHVKDSLKEEKFEYENRPYRFVDLENGDEIKLRPNEIRDSYAKKMSSFVKELDFRCGQYGIDFVEADINKGFDEILLPYLLKRKRLY